MKAHMVELASREEASAHAADLAAAQLQDALEAYEVASFMGSGGSTPGDMYRRLSGKALDWSRIVVGLVDERWVSADHPASNEKLLRETLLQNKAKAARILPMKTEHNSPQDAEAELEAAYAPYCEPISSVLLGMGADGHTASWFPGTKSLTSLIDPDQNKLVAGVDASGAPVAGDFPHRMTLTARAISEARAGILLIFGEDKKSVIEQSLLSDAVHYPVRAAIDGLGERLTIIWAP